MYTIADVLLDLLIVLGVLVTHPSAVVCVVILFMLFIIAVVGYFFYHDAVEDARLGNQ